MEKFKHIEKIGTLSIDKVLIESYYPILFICRNETEDLFLCSCCQANKDGKKWLVTKTDTATIIKVLKNEITLREAFIKYKEVRYSIFANEDSMCITENDAEDWNYETSIYLPDEGEYMDAEAGEFDEEISYYKNMEHRIMMNSFYQPIKLSRECFSLKLEIDKVLRENIEFYQQSDMGKINIKFGEFDSTYRKLMVDKIDQSDLNIFIETFHNKLKTTIKRFEDTTFNYEKENPTNLIYMKDSTLPLDNKTTESYPINHSVLVA